MFNTPTRQAQNLAPTKNDTNKKTVTTNMHATKNDRSTQPKTLAPCHTKITLPQTHTTDTNTHRQEHTTTPDRHDNTSINPPRHAAASKANNTLEGTHRGKGSNRQTHPTPQQNKHTTQTKRNPQPIRPTQNKQPNPNNPIRPNQLTKPTSQPIRFAPTSQ